METNIYLKLPTHIIEDIYDICCIVGKRIYVNNLVNKSNFTNDDLDIVFNYVSDLLTPTNKRFIVLNFFASDDVNSLKIFVNKLILKLSGNNPLFCEHLYESNPLYYLKLELPYPEPSIEELRKRKERVNDFYNAFFCKSDCGAK